MSNYKFDNNERYAVWKTLGPNCQWCKEPVEYKDCHIDHIIPETLINDSQNLAKVFTNYGLETSFNLNSFENWVPIHPSCNQSKSAIVIHGTPIIQQLLEHVKSKVTETEALRDKWKNQNQTAKLERIIEKGFLSGTIDRQVINNIFLRIDDSVSPIVGMTASTINNQVIYIPQINNWKVIKTETEFYTVEKEGKTGILPIGSTPDPKWLCINCKHYGPWDGNKCLNCNKTSYD